MIENIQIKNAALITEARISFKHGLNILSGETGAGKSMIIDAVNFMIGGRFGKDFIRNGEDAASVSGLFYISNNEVIKSVQEMGIDVENDNLLLIDRTIMSSGKSNAKINGKTVTIGMLKEVGSHLIDVHGQHEHQSLLNQNRHVDILDKFSKDKGEKYKDEIGRWIKKYKEISKIIKEISGEGQNINERIEFLSFQKNEIEQAKLKSNEEELLLEKRKILSNSQKLIEETEGALNFLQYSSEKDISACDGITKGLTLLQMASRTDKTVLNISEALEDVSLQLEQIVEDLNQYVKGLDYDPNELNKLEDRLTLIYSLKKKYGNSVENILAHLNKVTKQLNMLINSQEKVEELNSNRKKCTKEIFRLCQNLSMLRKEKAAKIEYRITEILRDLGMKHAQFSVNITQKKEFGQNGYDMVEFLISPNEGEPLKPLAKIASGGEMSRVMLALKTVLASADNIETFIFDEIDTGVSGRTAQSVAEKLAFIGKTNQILCITHLPQIAAMADVHFLIEKFSNEGRTVTNVTELTKDKEIEELARLTGGAKITEATLKAAEEMKTLANSLKK